MPELKPIHVVLILAAFACVALYVLGVGLGATDPTAEGGKPAFTPEELGRLRERFFKPRPVAPEELASETCVLNGATLLVPAGGLCEVKVLESKSRARRLQVEPQRGAVDVTFLSLSRPSVPAKVEGLAKPRAFDVAREGGTLRLVCPSAFAPTCVVALR